MSQFRTPLDVRRMRDGSADGRGTWQLLSDLVYQSDLLDRVITVPAGFVTDFASVPRIPVAYLLAGDEAHEEAVVHDWLYTTHLCDRATADGVFREAMGATGQAAWRSWLMWLGVRVGGASHWTEPGQPQHPAVMAAMRIA